jgi:hypothetical protein
MEQMKPKSKKGLLNMQLDEKDLTELRFPKTEFILQKHRF